SLSVRLQEAQGRLAQLEGKPPPANPASRGRNFRPAPITATSPVPSDTALPSPVPTATQPLMRPGLPIRANNSTTPDAAPSLSVRPPGTMPRADSADLSAGLNRREGGNYDRRLREVE